MHAAHIVVQGSPLLVRTLIEIKYFFILNVMQNCRTSFTQQHIGLKQVEYLTNCLTIT